METKVCDRCGSEFESDSQDDELCDDCVAELEEEDAEEIEDGDKESGL